MKTAFWLWPALLIRSSTWSSSFTVSIQKDILISFLFHTAHTRDQNTLAYVSVLYSASVSSDFMALYKCCYYYYCYYYIIFYILRSLSFSFIFCAEQTQTLLTSVFVLPICYLFYICLEFYYDRMQNSSLLKGYNNYFLKRPRLELRWPTVSGIYCAGHLLRYVTNQPPKANSAFHPSGSVNEPGR